MSCTVKKLLLKLLMKIKTYIFSLSLNQGGGDQVENTSVSGPGVMVEVKRIEVPATFDQLILTVLTTIGPPVSYTRTTSPNKITVVVPAKNGNFSQCIYIYEDFTKKVYFT